MKTPLPKMIKTTRNLPMKFNSEKKKPGAIGERYNLGSEGNSNEAALGIR
ncbi:1784_t:CDS:2, partial [Acaulospora colombiana]